MIKTQYDIRCRALEFATMVPLENAEAFVSAAKIIEAYLLDKEEAKNND